MSPVSNPPARTVWNGRSQEIVSRAICMSSQRTYIWRGKTLVTFAHHLSLSWPSVCSWNALVCTSSSRVTNKMRGKVSPVCVDVRSNVRLFEAILEPGRDGVGGDGLVRVFGHGGGRGGWIIALSRGRYISQTNLLRARVITRS